MASENVSTPQATSAASNIARRSLSIFSRRGYDAPSPAVHSLAVENIASSLAATEIPTPTPTQLPMHSNSKAKKWSKLRRQSDPKPSHGGTIIRLVPKESSPPPLTPLEIEMATAPNEEILRNIGLSPEESVSPVDAIYFAPTPSTSVSSRRKSKRERKNSQ